MVVAAPPCAAEAVLPYVAEAVLLAEAAEALPYAVEGALPAEAAVEAQRPHAAAGAEPRAPVEAA